MEAGIPFICTDYILWKGIVDIYKCGIYVEPGNVEQITSAIKFLFGNPNVAYEMGQNGRKAVQEKFNWHTQEKIYLDLFLKLNDKI